MDKIELALQLSEEILTSVETDALSTSTVALRCLRLARLMSDAEASEWLQYETSGYPRTKEGYIEPTAFKVACANGRETTSAKEGGRQIFSELADELEARIQTTQKAIGTLTTHGVSLSGDMIALTMRELRESVSYHTSAYLRVINDAQHHLTILRGKYYHYALSVNLELKFSQRAEEVFRSYRLAVDTRLIGLAPESLRRLDAAYERLTSSNPESWAQAITSCRRVFQEVADALFTGTRDTYTAKSGKVFDVSGDHYLNRLFASVDMLSAASTSHRLVGSNVLYVVDLVDNLHHMLNRGVHELKRQLTYDEARASILHTYILLGDLATLTLNEESNPA